MCVTTVLHHAIISSSSLIYTRYLTLVCFAQKEFVKDVCISFSLGRAEVCQCISVLEGYCIACPHIPLFATIQLAEVSLNKPQTVEELRTVIQKYFRSQNFMG